MTGACASVDGMFSVHLIRCGKHTATRPLCKGSLLPKVWFSIFYERNQCKTIPGEINYGIHLDFAKKFNESMEGFQKGREIK